GLRSDRRISEHGLKLIERAGIVRANETPQRFGALRRLARSLERVRVHRERGVPRSLLEARRGQRDIGSKRQTANERLIASRPSQILVLEGGIDRSRQGQRSDAEVWLAPVERRLDEILRRLGIDLRERLEDERPHGRLGAFVPFAQRLEGGHAAQVLQAPERETAHASPGIVQADEQVRDRSEVSGVAETIERTLALMLERRGGEGASHHRAPRIVVARFEPLLRETKVLVEEFRAMHAFCLVDRLVERRDRIGRPKPRESLEDRELDGLIRGGRRQLEEEGSRIRIALLSEAEDEIGAGFGRGVHDRVLEDAHGDFSRKTLEDETRGLGDLAARVVETRAHGLRFGIAADLTDEPQRLATDELASFGFDEADELTEDRPSLGVGARTA